MQVGQLDSADKVSYIGLLGQTFPAFKAAFIIKEGCHSAESELLWSSRHSRRKKKALYNVNWHISDKCYYQSHAFWPQPPSPGPDKLSSLGPLNKIGK